MTIGEYLQQQYTAGTAASYGREIEIFLSGYPLAAVAVYSDLMAYVGQLRLRYSNGQTLNRIVCSIKAYYDYLCYTGKRSDHPARAIRLRDRRSRDVQLQDLFSVEELEGLLIRKERYTGLTSRNKVLMSLLIYQGLQAGEMAALWVQSFNLVAGTVYIKRTAVSNGRTLSLKPNQVLLIYSYLQEVRPQLLEGESSDALLIGLRGHPMAAADITKHVKRSYAGVFGSRVVNAQTIRQSVITNLLKQGHDISMVQQYAGHKYPSSTERYRQQQVDRLQAAVEAYHPMK